MSAETLAALNAAADAYNGKSAEIDAKVNQAKGQFDTLSGQVSPGLQPIFSITPNQAGLNVDGSVHPDTWMISTNAGLTTWDLAGATTIGSANGIVANSLEEDFYTNVPGNQNVPPYKSTIMNFWRMSWDLGGGGAIPEYINAVSSSWVPRNGTMACWYKDESNVIPAADAVNGHRFHAGLNGWGIWSYANTPSTKAPIAGSYYHAQLRLKTSELPVQGSILIAGLAVIPCYLPVETVGWGIWPTLGRTVNAGVYNYQLHHVGNQWEYLGV